MLKVYPFLTVTHSCHETFTRRIYRYRQYDSQHAKKDEIAQEKNEKENKETKGWAGRCCLPVSKVSAHLGTFLRFSMKCPFGHQSIFFYPFGH